MMFCDPTQEHLTKLSQPWTCSYSGGKDSTSLVTWIEWLRRTGWITVDRPKLVQSDTTVEYDLLQAISSDMMDLLRECGWECTVVTPRISEKWYNRILGIGTPPVHPAFKKIQRRAGVTLITPEDEAFIRQCWKDKVYPRGWSEADEKTLPPELPLFRTTGQ